MMLNLGPIGISGHEALQKRLLRYLESRHFHPAVILAGDDKATRWQLAKNIAKVILCKKALTLHECRLCERVDRETHPDVLLIKNMDNEGIKIDLIREITQQMAIGSLEEPYKLCFLDESNLMNTAAANALLKTLEDPQPGRFFWLLTSQPGSLLPTIRSRCLKFSMLPQEKYLDDNEINKKLFDEFIKNKNPYQISNILDSKEKVSSFMLYLQKRCRDEVTQSSIIDPENLSRFENAVDIEIRLRSNANYGLMLENFLSQNFKYDSNAR